VQRLLEGLARLPQTVFLVVDDLHHLRTEDGLHGLERLLAQAPPQLRTFLVSRRDPKLALGRNVGRPYVEVGCLGGFGLIANMTQRLDLAEDLLRQAIAVADRVGWSTHPIVGVAYVMLGAVLIDRGRLAEGESLLERADPILTNAPEPAASVGLRHAQGMLEMSRGRFDGALAAFRDGERLAGQLRAPHFLAAVERPWQLRA
jgi:LuxR family maltose regulon positive regulatory protein